MSKLLLHYLSICIIFICQFAPIEARADIIAESQDEFDFLTGEGDYGGGSSYVGGGYYDDWNFDDGSYGSGSIDDWDDGGGYAGGSYDWEQEDFSSNTITYDHPDEWFAATGEDYAGSQEYNDSWDEGIDDWGFDQYGGFVDQKTGDYYDSYTGEYFGNVGDLGYDIIPQDEPKPEFNWLSPSEGKPTVIYSQAEVDQKYAPDPDSFTAQLIRENYNDPARPARPYVGTGKIMEVLADQGASEVEKLKWFIHNDGGYADSRYGITSAMRDQGYAWKDERNPVTEELFLEHLGDNRLPAIGQDEKSYSYYRNFLPDSVHGRPQIGIQRDMQTTHPEDHPQYSEAQVKYPTNEGTMYIHEYEHSSQIDPWEDIAYVGDEPKGIYGWNKKMADVDERLSTPAASRVASELPAWAAEVGAYAIDHRNTTGKELDATIKFPSGKEVSAAFIGRQLEQRNYFTPDSETGNTRTVTELLSSDRPEVKQWIKGLAGPGKGSVSMGSENNKVTNPSWWYGEEEPLVKTGKIETRQEWQKNFNASQESPFSEQAIDILKENDAARDFLNRLGD